MRVGILTWHQAINHGAVLQAYSSCQVLKKMGVTPIILDYDWDIYDDHTPLQKIVNKIRNISLSKVFQYFKNKKFVTIKNEQFASFSKEMLPIGEKYSIEKDLDAVLIGSDMVFDIIEGYNPYMYGYGVPCNYIFSYAASFGYTTIQELQKSQKAELVAKYLSQMKEIGYRDKNTSLICELLKVDIPKVENIDPVLCYGFADELEDWDTGKWINERYILIYAYSSTLNDKDEVNEISRFAKEHGLKIVSCGYYHAWCDESIPASPCEFVELFKHAQYIVTDTFHGSIFASLFHKQFVSIIRKNGFKVEYFLRSSHLDGQIANKSSDIPRLLTNQIDYVKYERWLEKERQKSWDFIKRNVENAR